MNEVEMQDVYTWFSDITGLPEHKWLEHRAESIILAPNGTDLLVRNLRTAELHEAGCFRTHSLSELSTRTKHAVQQKSPPPFELHLRSDRQGIRYVDVAHLQAHAQEHTLFQVASNFNCAEVPHTSIHPNNGTFVSNLAIDHTQGPAASASAPISSITRIHAPFYNPNTPANTWGQTQERQIELLGHPLVSSHFPVENGKLIFHRSEPKIYNEKELFPHIRVGIHQRVRAYYGHRYHPFMEKVPLPPQIDQVFVAALNKNAPLPYTEHIESKTTFLLRAAYQGTYLSAALCQNSRLVLTLIGGGSFGNPLKSLAKTIAHTHRCYSPYTNLNKVILPLFPNRGVIQGIDFPNLLVRAFQKEGIEDTLIIKEV
jgi:hypothetical protein